MADKDVDGVIDALAGAASLTDATIICTSLDVPRAMPALELAARWRAILAARRGAGAGAGAGRRGAAHVVIAERDPIAALERALAAPGPVLVAGSLYLVGTARGHLIDDPAFRDPDPAEDA
jgi:folylpolyglutamate synthase/dihydropteroate synthase